MIENAPKRLEYNKMKVCDNKIAQQHISKNLLDKMNNINCKFYKKFANIFNKDQTFNN